LEKPWKEHAKKKDGRSKSARKKILSKINAGVRSKKRQGKGALGSPFVLNGGGGSNYKKERSKKEKAPCMDHTLRRR